MAKVDSCNAVVGSGDTIIAAGAYKVGDDTRYKFGIRVDIPSQELMGKELTDKIFAVGLHRIMSVKAAGLFNKATDYGTEEEAKKFSEQFSTVAGWLEAFEKARREGGAVTKVDSSETLAIKRLAGVLKQRLEAGTLADAKVPIVGIDNPPKAKNGSINFIAWAKLNKDHPWYKVAHKQVTQDKGFE